MALRRLTLTKEQPPWDCARCSTPLPLVRHYKQVICTSCSEERGRAKTGWEAQRMVGLAVRLGYLKQISQCLCVDCGAAATDYDHRDYNKPLDVEPVCRSCNFKRGPAILKREGDE